jgi:hypothetical protein
MLTRSRCWIEMLSSLTGLELLVDDLPSHKWLGYYQGCLPCHGQTPARRLRVAGKRMLWRAGRGFVVRDLPECARPRAQQRGRARRHQIDRSAQQSGHCSGRGRPHSAVIALGTSRTRCRWATWAWMAASSRSLTIAQPFMAGFTVRECSKSRQGRKKYSAVPDGTFKFQLHCSQP